MIRFQTLKGFPTNRGLSFSLFPVLTYNVVRWDNVNEHDLEIGIFFWSIWLKWNVSNS